LGESYQRKVHPVDQHKDDRGLDRCPIIGMYSRIFRDKGRTTIRVHERAHLTQCVEGVHVGVISLQTVPLERSFRRSFR
jgi:hypothetical protein